MSGPELAIGFAVLAVVCSLMFARALMVELEEARGGVARARASQAGADRRAEQARKHQAGADRRAHKLWRERERVELELKRTERELLKLRLRGRRRAEVEPVDLERAMRRVRVRFGWCERNTGTIPLALMDDEYRNGAAEAMARSHRARVRGA